MAKRIIRTGTTADPTGDSLKNAFTKVNDNFTELYNALGLDADTLNLGAFEFTGSTMSTTDSSAIIIDQAATITSNLSVGGDILPSTANGGDLGSSTLPWRSLYVSNNTIYIGGVPLGLDANGNLTVNGSQVTGGGVSSLVNGSKTVSLGSDGNLTLPAGGTILNSSGQPYVNGVSSINTSVSESIFTDASGDYTYGTLSYDYAVNGVSNSFSIEYSRPLVGGNVDINVGNTIVNGDLTLSGDIKSNGNINIDINLADSTLRRWQFGEDGILTLPGGKVQVQASSSYGSIQGSANTPIIVYAGGTTGQVSLQWTNADPENNVAATAFSGVTVNSGNTGDVKIITGAYNPMNGIFDKTWNFGTDGNLTLPGDIRSEREINIDINLSDSTLRRWRFGEDGNLTFPDGTSQSSAGISANSTDTLTNKTINIQAGQGNVFQIQGNSITSYSGSGAVLALTSMPTFSGMNVNNSSLSIDGGSGSYYWAPTFADGTGTIHKAGVYKSAADANNSLFSFGANGAGTMSVVMDGSLFIGSALPANNGGLNTDYGGWLVVQAGAKFGGDLNTIGNFILDTPGNYVRFGDATTQTTAYTGTANLATVARNIENEGDVEIRVNLTDSTTRVWRFGEDGDLAFPDGTTQTTAFAGNAATIDVLNTNGIDTNYSITFVENRDGAEILRADVDLTFNSATNTLTAGNVEVKQTITGGIIESGSDFIITSQPNPDRNNACNIGIYPGFASDTASEAGFVSIQGGSTDVVGLAGGDVYLRGGAHTNGGVGGTIKVESILKIDDGVHEKFQTKADATGTVTHDCSSGHVFYHTSPDADWTANFTNLNLASGYATAVTLIIVQGGTGYYPSAVQIGGVGQSLNWQGNATPTPSTNRTDVVTFSIINNSGTYTVLGQLTGF